jgi:hypothetical protein
MAGIIAFSKTSVPDMLEITGMNFEGKQRTITVNVTEECFLDSYKKWQQGVLIQNAFPYLSADEREFLMTGSTDEDWYEMFPKQ